MRLHDKLVLPSEGYLVSLRFFKAALSPKNFLRIDSFLFDLPLLLNQLGFLSFIIIFLLQITEN